MGRGGGGRADGRAAVSAILYLSFALLLFRRDLPVYLIACCVLLRLLWSLLLVWVAFLCGMQAMWSLLLLLLLLMLLLQLLLLLLLLLARHLLTIFLALERRVLFAPRNFMGAGCGAVTSHASFGVL